MSSYTKAWYICGGSRTSSSWMPRKEDVLQSRFLSQISLEKFYQQPCFSVHACNPGSWELERRIRGPHLKNKDEQTEKAVLFMYFNKTAQTITLNSSLPPMGKVLEELFIQTHFPLHAHKF